MTKLSPPNFGDGDVANVLVEVMHVLLLFPPQYLVFKMHRIRISGLILNLRVMGLTYPLGHAKNEKHPL